MPGGAGSKELKGAFFLSLTTVRELLSLRNDQIGTWFLEKTIAKHCPH